MFCAAPGAQFSSADAYGVSTKSQTLLLGARVVVPSPQHFRVRPARVMSPMALGAPPTILSSLFVLSENKLDQHQNDNSTRNTLIYSLIYGIRSLLGLFVYML